MQTRNLSLEKIVMDRLRQTYESKGYRFLAEPSPALLPDFLRDLSYRPDAIALKKDGGVVIELKLNRTQTKHQKLSDLAATVSKHAGWEFKLLFMSEQPDLVPDVPGDVHEGTVRDQIAEAEALWEAGHRRAALLLGWAAFEAAARTAVRFIAKDFQGDLQFSTQIIEASAMYGVLGSDEAQDIRQVMRTRNAIAHGNFDIDVSQQDFSALIRCIKAALCELSLPKAIPH